VWLGFEHILGFPPPRVKMGTPIFIDSVHAAELLGVSQETVLDWVSEGKLRAYGGRPSNPFVRSPDVMVLASEMGLGPREDRPRRVKSGSARVQTRITADARWSEVSDDDIREWAVRADSTRKQAAMQAVAVARERLEALLRVLEE
jgi:hypothetical protein